MPKNLNAGRLIIVVIVALASPAFGQSFEKPSYIQWNLAGIRAEGDPDIRRAKAEYLVEGIYEGRANDISDDDVNALASLLPDRDVQIYMASILGKIGPRARRAVPALVTAIAGWHSQVGTPRTGIWSPSIMCDALGQIDFSQRPADCAEW